MSMYTLEEGVKMFISEMLMYGVISSSKIHNIKSQDNDYLYKQVGQSYYIGTYDYPLKESVHLDQKQKINISKRRYNEKRK